MRKRGDASTDLPAIVSIGCGEICTVKRVKRQTVERWARDRWPGARYRAGRVALCPDWRGRRHWKLTCT